MSVPTTPADLLDLKMLPAWVNEPARGNEYADYRGEEESSFDRPRRGPQHGRETRPRGAKPREQRDRGRRPDRADRPQRAAEDRRPPREAPAPLPRVDVRFLPHLPALESVIAQMKSGTVAYSVFALARLFLDKPERYGVRLTATEGAALYQLGEDGAVATDQRLLENGAFASTVDEFYSVEQTQTGPVKGNFSNVARCRLSGTLLGPTNHHSYQPQLRNLYEQRFSRRMSFQDYQRQIEIVNDPAVVEQWKEQARSVTTYTAKGQEPATAFQSVADAERHFRQTHLPSLLRSAAELTVSGVVSRRLPDRALGRVIEDAWSTEMRSPSRMMQELASALREAGLNIFRHRRGMLFVSPIRTRAFGHDRSTVSSSVNGILEKLSETPGIKRKELAAKLTPAPAEAADVERAKMTLISDLHWLISEGYVIEFNDGTLDLPRAKTPPPTKTAINEATPAGASAVETEHAAPMIARPEERSPDVTSTTALNPSDESTGMTVQQSIEPNAAAAPEGESSNEVQSTPKIDDTAPSAVE